MEQQTEIFFASPLQLVLLEVEGMNVITGDPDLTQTVRTVSTLRELGDLREELVPLRSALPGALVESPRYPVCDQLYIQLFEIAGLIRQVSVPGTTEDSNGS